MSLSVQDLDNFIEAQEISDERQIFTVARVFRVCECAGHDVAEFGDVAHVNDAQHWIKRKSPAHRSVGLLLRRQGAQKALVVHRRDDESVIRKSRFFNYPIDLGLAGKVGHVEFATAN